MFNLTLFNFIIYICILLFLFFSLKVLKNKCHYLFVALYKLLHIILVVLSLIVLLFVILCCYDGTSYTFIIEVLYLNLEVIGLYIYILVLLYHFYEDDCDFKK